MAHNSFMLTDKEVNMAVGLLTGKRVKTNGAWLTNINPSTMACYDGLDQFLELQGPNLTQEDIQRMEQFYKDNWDNEVYLISYPDRVAGMIAFID